MPSTSFRRKGVQGVTPWGHESLPAGSPYVLRALRRKGVQGVTPWSGPLQWL